MTLVEVGPRDGLQSEPEILRTESKARFVELAIGAGLTRLEVASFAHPERVPQMADADGCPYEGEIDTSRIVEIAKQVVAAGPAELGIADSIGGCPFAPAATGNIPTDDLLYMLDRSGIETGVSLKRIIAASDWLAAELGRAVPAMLPKAGIFPRQ